MSVVYGGCDSGIAGNAFENQPPDTQLSVQDESLLDNLGEDDRLTSTVRITWVGDDPDGFVSGYEIRYYDTSFDPEPESGWNLTQATDSTILLPVQSGERTSNVVFEVRSIDDQELRDPTPARTVFPIKNTPPDVRLSPFELPPDTTFTVVSFALDPSDPDGEDNLKSISISLNDSTSFVDLDPDVDFVTLVADQQAVRGGAPVTDARVFTGRGAQSTSISVPGMLMNGENTFYVRTVDRADTTSAIARHSWHVKRNTSDVLYVNDYRLSTNRTVLSFHLSLLREYLPEGTPVDIWDISTPFASGSSGLVPRSDLVPSVADPTLRLTLSLFDHIYWVSTSTTSNSQTDNMAFIAPILDAFFADGGTMMVHSPVAVPFGVTDFDDNAAVLLLPLSEPLVIPDSLRRLELSVGGLIEPTSDGQSINLPPLVADRFFFNVLPYNADSQSLTPLYEANLGYRTFSNNSGTWTDVRTVASISADNRIGLLSLPLVNDQNGNIQFLGEDGRESAVGEAVHGMLNLLGFPER